nr:helix-turn-helix transcriptional regulator [Pseudomonas amygdali]
MMSLRLAFATAMKFVRAHRRLLQQDVSGGVTQARISQLESGKNSATLETTQQVAKAMGMTTNSFVICRVSAQWQKSGSDPVGTHQRT